MSKFTKLSRGLLVELPELNKARIKLIAQAVISISASGTANMSKIASGMMGKAKRLSKYRRLQRFIYEKIWMKINLLNFPIKVARIRGPFVLIIDRTIWKF